MSEYRLPEDDTIGGQRDPDEDRDEAGPPPETGEQPASEEPAES